MHMWTEIIQTQKESPPRSSADRFRGKKKRKEKFILLCHHLLWTLSMVTDCCSPNQAEGNDGKVDQALEEEEEVGVIGRGIDELQLKYI